MDNVKDDLRAVAQKMADRNVAARAELASSNAEIASFLADLDQADSDAHAFLKQYQDPTQPNPTPVAPEVAAPAPAEEPPVFTDVTSTELTPGATSGGSADVHEDLDTTAVVAPPTDQPTLDMGSGSGAVNGGEGGGDGST